MSLPTIAHSAKIEENVHTRTGTSISPDSVPLRVLASEIRAELEFLQDHDSIHACGKAALAILKVRPLEALQLAKDHVQNTPFRDVRKCWLRLYEDASLWRAAELLCDAGDASADVESNNLSDTDDWLSKVVRVLDLGLVVSGGTLRGELYEAIFANLEPFVDHSDIIGDISRIFDMDQPEGLSTKHAVSIVSQPSLEEFQMHLNNYMTPLLLVDTINDWPAVETWQNPGHLLRLTLGGRRCVPIEIGETYTHADWRQEIMPFRKFMHDYLSPVDPKEIGYLGQHNLFHQIPKLQQDIRIPDYCYTAPPEGTLASRLGIPVVPPVDEPQKNVWLGPKGTRTPLHTDPYHNIFCQVVGHKYVRIYPPEATESVYPRGEDENGINESNTSEVEIRLDRRQANNVIVEDAEGFPLFMSQTNYYEVIVGPGECLYIPAGWWHYIESLTASYSVSFWWN
ncbi:hypothetical protein MBLNU13_g00382t1 [Cladosporium sp. NU13]